MAHESPLYYVVGQLGDPQHFRLESKFIPELTLRIPGAVDIPTVMDILQNKANSEFDKSISEATVEELEAIAQRWTTVADPPTHVNFLVCKNEQPL